MIEVDACMIRAAGRLRSRDDVIMKMQGIQGRSGAWED